MSKPVSRMECCPVNATRNRQVAWSRRVVGWSIADHIRSELVVDAVQMAIWRRCPPRGQTVAHSDYGSSTPHGPSVDDSALRDCWARWDRSATASLTVPSRASLEPSSSSSPTNTAGRHASSWLWPYSTGSRPGRTRGGATASATCSARSTTKASTAPTAKTSQHEPLRVETPTPRSPQRPAIAAGGSKRPGNPIIC